MADSGIGGAAVVTSRDACGAAVSSPREVERLVTDPQACPSAGTLVGESLRAFDYDEHFASWVVEGAGLEFRLDVRQTWRFAEMELPVSVWLDDDNRYVLRIHDGGPLNSLCLGELYAATQSSKIRRLHSVALAEWKRRALVEAGLAVPNEVALATLPPGAPASARKTWDVIRRILEVRICGEREIALSAPTIALWWSCNEWTISNGKIWLKQNGYIEKVAEKPGRYSNPTYIWRIRLAGEPPFTTRPTGRGQTARF